MSFEFISTDLMSKDELCTNIAEHWVEDHWVDEFWVDEFWVDEFWVDEFWVDEFWVDEFWVDDSSLRSPYLWSSFVLVAALIAQSGQDIGAECDR